MRIETFISDNVLHERLEYCCSCPRALFTERRSAGLSTLSVPLRGPLCYEFFTKYYSGDQIKNNGKYGTYGEEERCIESFGAET
jgi:hypothetical protein